MSSSINFANQRNPGWSSQNFFIRAPKKNHDALAKIGKQTDDLFRKHVVPNMGID
jgi:hypothetical protein